MTNGNLTLKNPTKKVIDVAIAVLMYQADDVLGRQYLVARRDQEAHQGGKLEFVGGKVAQDETAASALVRELDEELGLDIQGNHLVKMGRIRHDYGDRLICLHVYGVFLPEGQFLQFSGRTIGREGQALYWLAQDELVSRRADFPDANQAIFDWLMLPHHLVISHQIDESGFVAAWADFYAHKLPQNAAFVPRVSEDVLVQAVDELSAHRKDISWVLPIDFEQARDLKVIGKRLTQSQLLNGKVWRDQMLTHPLIISCHDEESINKANELAIECRVLGILLSPVRPTKTHPDAKALGFVEFCRLAQLSDVPVLALGGLGRADLVEVQQYGAWGVAGIRGMLD